MILPTDPMQAKCKKCGHTQLCLGHSDVISHQSCKCGGTDF